MVRKSRGSTPPSEAPIAPGERKRMVVGIGASAGGLAALRAFFGNVTPDTGISYVVVVHLAPTHESHLANLLQPHCAIPVHQVNDIVALEPDQVYVIAPGNELSAIDSHLRPTLVPGGTSSRAPIDHFFRTLGQTYDGHSVAVVLTGTGADGAMGIRSIKENGGITIVQDPLEAEWDGMPRAALATGMVDLVLPVAEMPARIAALARLEPLVPLVEEQADEPSNADTEKIMQQIFAQIRARTGQDFSGYKIATVGRRIERRMQLVQIDQLRDYVDLLSRDTGEAHALAEDLLINVTSFFRDPAVFEKLATDVLPMLFDNRGPHDRVRVWSVGCATGEEAYSLAILLLEEAARHPSPPQIQVFASDLHDNSLGFAREAFYPHAIELDVSPERLARFFVRESDGYRVRREVRDVIVFASHNVLKDPPFTKQDVISCRNLLIYLRRETQEQVMTVFHYALKEDGYLLLGSAETVDRSDMFRLESKANYLYRRRQPAAGETRFPIFPAPEPPSLPHRPRLRREAVPTTDDVPSYGTMHAQLLGEFAPPSMLVSSDHAIVHLSDHAGRFLQHPGGALTNNVFSLLRQELRLELRAGLHAATRTGEWRSAPVPMVLDGVERAVTLQLRAAERPGDQIYYLVVFDEVVASEPPGDRATADATTSQLEAELRATRERLQSVIEEYEASQEEMRASNEELQSMNEELRSTLEELETSKEELQSINEELQTVNQENQHRVEELSQLSADLHNLLKSTDIATIFLDRSFRILRFTPRVTDFLAVRSSDRGRPLADLSHRLGFDDLMDQAARVLETLVPVEREVFDVNGHVYLARILPYRSTEDRIDGVVLTFVDISAMKRAERAVRQSEERTRLALDAARMGSFVWYPDEKRFEADRRMRELFGLTPDARLDLADDLAILIHPDDRERYMEAIQRSLDERGDGLFHADVRIPGDVHAPRWVALRGRMSFEGNPPLPVRMAGVVADITGQMTAEAGMRALNATLEHRVRKQEVREEEERRRSQLAATSAEELEQQLRETRARLIIAEQVERRRIAEILHNDLQQRLYGLQLKLDSVRAGASADDPERLAELSEQAVSSIRQTIDVVRRVALDLNPPVLQGDSVEDLAVWLQAQMIELHGLRIGLDLEEGLPNPDPETRVVLFHALRELLFNVVKHAGVKGARLAVHRENGGLTVVVEDGGDGFHLSDPDGNGKASYGLASIRDRLLLVGGSMTIESTIGRGTTVTLRIPLPEPESSRE